MKDFTFKSFHGLLLALRRNGYTVLPVFDAIESINGSTKIVMLRHDVDKFPAQTRKMARMEADNNFHSTFYFRILPSVFKPEIISEVVALGHEIGYHYEDLSLCGGNLKASIEHFELSLEKLRKYYPVKTICMHGSPLSKWDNKTIWQHYDYKKYGILADTSLDIDYQKVFYISDNGRAWNRTSVSVRDKVVSSYDIPIKSSFHLIELIKQGKLPDKIMINAHPDTFFDFGIKYGLNWAFIEAKNLAKWVIVKYGLR